MLKCDVFLGCFGNCDETIPSNVIPTEIGIFSYEFYFNNVLHKNTIEVTELTEIMLPNVFTPSMLHCVKISNPSNQELKKVSFKIHTQCS